VDALQSVLVNCEVGLPAGELFEGEPAVDAGQRGTDAAIRPRSSATNPRGTNPLLQGRRSDRLGLRRPRWIGAEVLGGLGASASLWGSLGVSVRTPW